MGHFELRGFGILIVAALVEMCHVAINIYTAWFRHLVLGFLCDYRPFLDIKMAVKQFYLLGEPSSSAQNIELEPTLDTQALQHLIAGHFAIVEHSGWENLSPTKIHYH